MKRLATVKVFLLIALAAVLLAAVPAEAQIASTFRNFSMNCGNCHSLHGAPGGFLSKDVDSTTLCLSCHDPNATGSTLKATVHTNTGNSAYDYDPTDPAATNPDGSVNYWVGCLGCHNPHYNLVNIRGITADGHVNDGAGNLLDDPPPPAGSVTEGQFNDCTDTVPNTGLCNNFKLLGNVRDDTNGAKIRTPGISDTEANCNATGGTPVFDSTPTYIGCERTQLIGRLEPLAVGKGQSKVDYNDWVRDTSTASGAYIGMCQTCHTRTQHHRNTDSTVHAAFPVSGADRTHNVTRRCTDCHAHNLGFSKNQ
jgi:predicted CXXCH cytochrome family protein